MKIGDTVYWIWESSPDHYSVYSGRVLAYDDSTVVVVSGYDSSRQEIIFFDEENTEIFTQEDNAYQAQYNLNHPKKN